tara:strand:+ start:1966 stop:2595 length:630 start_codon:yes stop_codon:yes gene_type:complete
MMDERLRELLDMEKYERRGAYHWEKYAKEKECKDFTDKVLNHFISVEENTGQDIIEVGCGDGLWIHLIGQKGYNICGIDANELAIELAKGKGLDKVSHSFLLDYEGEHDVCIMFDVFEHFEEPEKSVDKLTEIIKERIYVLNPLWTAKYHHDYYDTPKIVALFEKDWELTHEVTLSGLSAAKKKPRRKVGDTWEKGFDKGFLQFSKKKL